MHFQREFEQILFGILHGEWLFTTDGTFAVEAPNAGRWEGRMGRRQDTGWRRVQSRCAVHGRFRATHTIAAAHGFRGNPAVIRIPAKFLKKGGCEWRNILGRSLKGGSSMLNTFNR